MGCAHEQVNAARDASMLEGQHLSDHAISLARLVRMVDREMYSVGAVFQQLIPQLIKVQPVGSERHEKSPSKAREQIKHAKKLERLAPT
jgi:hypothetical protein